MRRRLIREFIIVVISFGLATLLAFRLANYFKPEQGGQCPIPETNTLTYNNVINDYSRPNFWTESGGDQLQCR